MMLGTSSLWGGKTERCLPKKELWPDSWLMDYTDNHWSTMQSNVRWVEKIVVPWVAAKRLELGLAEDQWAIMLIDLYAANRCREVVDALKANHIQPFFVPAGLTDDDAPHDQKSINGKFKITLKHEHHKYHVSQVQKYLQNNKANKAANFKFDAKLSTLKRLHASWIRTAVESIKPTDIAKAWRKSGVAHALTLPDALTLPPYPRAC